MSTEQQLAKERRARMAAERMLDLKQEELREANKRLSRHALSLSNTIVEQREEAQTVKGELETATAKIEIAERRLWDSIETIEDGFAVFNPDNVLIAANSAFLAPFDGLVEAQPGVTYRRLLVLASEEGLVDLGNADRRDWVDQMLWRWGQDRIDPMVIQLWNGTSIKLIDQRSRDGDMVSLALNITDTIRKEEKLKEARLRAEAANRAKSAFLANMSHEIRTPMNGVVAMADLLAESNLDEEQTLYVDTIKSSGQALLVLINDVLDYSKIEAEKLTIRPAPFDLEQTLHDVATMLQTTARQKDLDILIDYDMFLPREFVGDGGRIRQVVTNLVGNAIKFTNAGHVAIRAIGLPAPDLPGEQRIHVMVEDTGIGIPADKLSHIFGEFNQVEDERNRRYDGTGLGLSITKRLITLMGGDVWVDSELGSGSSFGFAVTFPMVQGQSGADDVIPDWLERVIVADAQGQQREILAKQLTARGLRVANAGTTDDLMDMDLGPRDVVLLSTNLFEDLRADVLDGLGGRGSVILLSGTPIALPQGQNAVVAQLQRPVRRADLFSALTRIAAPARAAEPASASVLSFASTRLRTGQAAPADLEATAEPIVENIAEDAGEAPGQVADSGEDGTVTDAAIEPSAVPVPRRKMRVLAADDNKTNRFVFGKLVKALNIELTFATNGQEAVEAFQTIDPDLVFMDISMPVVDGKEATRQIRQIEVEKSLNRTTIVALTAHAMDGDDQAILAAGLDHYLTKPFVKDAIIARIEAEAPDHCEPVLATQDQVA